MGGLGSIAALPTKPFSNNDLRLKVKLSTTPLPDYCSAWIALSYSLRD